MADYSVRVETTTRVVYTLPSPTYWGEVGKTFAAMRADMEAHPHGAQERTLSDPRPRLTQGAQKP